MHLVRHIAVRRLDAVTFSRQPLLHLFSNKHRTVLPTRAAESNSQITLPFLDVMREQEGQHLRGLRPALSGRSA